MYKNKQNPSSKFKLNTKKETINKVIMPICKLVNDIINKIVDKTIYNKNLLFLTFAKSIKTPLYKYSNIHEFSQYYFKFLPIIILHLLNFYIKTFAWFKNGNYFHFKFFIFI